MQSHVGADTLRVLRVAVESQFSDLLGIIRGFLSLLRSFDNWSSQLWILISKLALELIKPRLITLAVERSQE